MSDSSDGGILKSASWYSLWNRSHSEFVEPSSLRRIKMCFRVMLEMERSKKEHRTADIQLDIWPWSKVLVFHRLPELARRRAGFTAFFTGHGETLQKAVRWSPQI